jgi:[acyl-carrier-protein] S-malonyltransferase
MTDPSIPVISNVHARAMNTADELRADIKAQMDSRVRWTELVEGMVKSGTQAFVEVGSGDVLVGMIKRIDRNVSRFSLGTPVDFENLEG